MRDHSFIAHGDMAKSEREARAVRKSKTGRVEMLGAGTYEHSNTLEAREVP